MGFLDKDVFPSTQAGLGCLPVASCVARPAPSMDASIRQRSSSREKVPAAPSERAACAVLAAFRPQTNNGEFGRARRIIAPR